MQEEFHKVYPYQVPEWAKHLQNIPQHYVKLSNLNTPIHEWNIPGIPNRFIVYIKRDDLTGSVLTGNKVRTLQLIFADALTLGYRHVVSGAGPQSNYCRAVALIARSLGLNPHLVIQGVDEDGDLGFAGNILLYRLVGSHIYLTPKQISETFDERLKAIQKHISAKYNEKCYVIPKGGANVKGIYGYISAFHELVTQGLHDRFDDIVLSMGTGCTAAGLAVGNYLTGSKLKVHGIAVYWTKERLIEHIDILLQELGLTGVKTDDLLDIIEGYAGEFSVATEEDLGCITRVSHSTGVLLDPCFTGKGTRGMIEELNKNPSRFKGTRILFIHTGGLFCLFDNQITSVISKPESETNKVYKWPTMSISPLVKEEIGVLSYIDNDNLE